MMNRIILLTIISAFALQSYGQQDTGSVIIHKDPRLDMLVNKQIEINEITTRHSRRSAPGFRLLVISSNNRNTVTDAKTKIYRQFPELKAYMMYQAPFFRLKVGNFREREEAEGYLAGVQALFDNKVYVVPDTVEIRPDLED